MSKEQKIQEIWDLTANSLIDVLNDPQRNSPGWVQCALRFLQDNGAEALNVPSSKKEEIKKLLPFPKLSERKIG